MGQKLRGALYLSLASSIWGGMFIAVRLSVPVIPPVPLVFLRYLTAAVVLFAVGRSLYTNWSVERRYWRLLFFVGLIGQGLSIVTQETGTMLTSAQMGSVITASTPAFMVIFAHFILKERLTAARALSVVLATCGVLFIVIDPENLQAASLWGGASLVIAALTWALMSVLLKLLVHISPLVITFYAVLVALFLLAPYSLWWLFQADWQAMAAPTVWGSVLYLGMVSTAGGFILWNKGLILMDASVGGLFLFFQPVVGTLLGWLLLGEQITLFFWLGAFLVFGGVLLALRSPGS